MLKAKLSTKWNVCIDFFRDGQKKKKKWVLELDGRLETLLLQKTYYLEEKHRLEGLQPIPKSNQWKALNC